MRKIVAFLCLGTLLVAATWASVALAFGGGGNPVAAPPLGKIYFDLSGSTYSMNADGTAKQAVSLVLDGPLSAKTYDGSHWHLIAAESGETFKAVDTSGMEIIINGIELYAHRWTGGAWQVVRITDFSRSGLRMWGGSAAWSNDRLDTFVSKDVTGFALDGYGRYIYDPAKSYPKYIVRIAVSGADLTAPGFLPIGAEDLEFEIAVASTATPSDWDAICGAHSWSPDGKKLTVSNVSTGVGGIHVWDIASASRQLLYAGGAHTWSPDGTKILLQDGGNIRTINPDGSGLKTLRAWTNRNWGYYDSRWSPDGAWIVYLSRSTQTKSSISRIPTAGGTEVQIVNHGGGLRGWFAQ